MSGEFRKELVRVVVDGETISQEVYVDNDTGLDVDAHSGVFRTRKETMQHIEEVYLVGKDSMRGELERYNKWMVGGGGKRQDPLMPTNAPVLKKVATPSASGYGGDNAARLSSSSSVNANKMDLPSIDRQCSQWKEAANTHFIEKKYRHALLLYSRIEGLLGKLLLSYDPAKRSVPQKETTPSSTILIPTALPSSNLYHVTMGLTHELLTAMSHDSSVCSMVSDGSSSNQTSLLSLPLLLSSSEELLLSLTSVAGVKSTLPQLYFNDGSAAGNGGTKSSPSSSLPPMSKQANTKDRRTFLSICFSNAAEAHLRLDRPLEGYRCALVAIAFDNSNVKSKYRAATAALGTGKLLVRLLSELADEEAHAENSEVGSKGCAAPPMDAARQRYRMIRNASRVMSPSAWFEEGLEVMAEVMGMLGEETDPAVVEQMSTLERQLLDAAEVDYSHLLQHGEILHDAANEKPTPKQEELFDRFGYF